MLNSFNTLSHSFNNLLNFEEVASRSSEIKYLSSAVRSFNTSNGGDKKERKEKRKRQTDMAACQVAAVGFWKAACCLLGAGFQWMWSVLHMHFFRELVIKIIVNVVCRERRRSRKGECFAVFQSERECLMEIFFLKSLYSNALCVASSNWQMIPNADLHASVFALLLLLTVMQEAVCPLVDCRLHKQTIRV